VGRSFHNTTGPRGISRGRTARSPNRACVNLGAGGQRFSSPTNAHHHRNFSTACSREARTSLAQPYEYPNVGAITNTSAGFCLRAFTYTDVQSNPRSLLENTFYEAHAFRHSGRSGQSAQGYGRRTLMNIFPRLCDVLGHRWRRLRV